MNRRGAGREHVEHLHLRVGLVWKGRAKMSSSIIIIGWVVLFMLMGALLGMNMYMVSGRKREKHIERGGEREGETRPRVVPRRHRERCCHRSPPSPRPILKNQFVPAACPAADSANAWIDAVMIPPLSLSPIGACVSPCPFPLASPPALPPPRRHLSDFLSLSLSLALSPQTSRPSHS